MILFCINTYLQNIYLLGKNNVYNNWRGILGYCLDDCIRQADRTKKTKKRRLGVKCFL